MAIPLPRTFAFSLVLPLTSSSSSSPFSSTPCPFSFCSSSTCLPSSISSETSPQQRPTIILSETTTSRHSSGGPSAYPQYLRHLEKVSRSLHSTSPSSLSTTSTNAADPSSHLPHQPNPVAAGGVDDFTRGYYDWLQAPLQPLMDDLQSSTYEVFERDPVKYAKYEEAITLALGDREGDESLCVLSLSLVLCPY